MRQPHVDAGRAVDAGHVVVAVRPVDVGGERAARRVGLRVLEQRRRGARPRFSSTDSCVLIQRQVGDVLRLRSTLTSALSVLSRTASVVTVTDSLNAPTSSWPLMRTMPQP